MAVRALKEISPQEYLAAERQAETKSEYLDGVVVAMAGVTKEHARIDMNLTRLIANQLNESPCEPFGSDMRVRAEACNRYYYPDLSVVCGEPQFEDEELDSLTNPVIVFEILSKSTEKYDRNEKFDCYGTIPSLTTYVLVAQDQPRVEVYTRHPDGSWRYEVAKSLEGVLRLPAIGLEAPLADIYARVEFPPEPPQPVCEACGQPKR